MNTELEKSNGEQTECKDNLPISSIMFFTIGGLIAGILIGAMVSLKIGPDPETSALPQEPVSQTQTKPGNFVILENSTTSITFNGFEGELVWYESDGDSDFYPLGGSTPIKNGKPIPVPNKARALLKKGKSTGNTYSMEELSSTR